ncbi:hypothetical protein ABPG75_011409 [Micractinium tetrahymenae]
MVGEVVEQQGLAPPSAEGREEPRGALGASSGAQEEALDLGGSLDVAGDAEPSVLEQLSPPPQLPPPAPEVAPDSSESGATALRQPRRRTSMETAMSAPAELSPSKSWLRRAQNRADDLRQQFDLPADEVFLEDFMCALKKRMLLQGRMYVFSQHVCFSSTLFGYHKVKVIPLSEVADVRKKKNVGFPNSIEFIMLSGKREFFTSFLARADAYKLIMAQWRECSDLAPPPSPTAEAEAGGEAVVMRRSSMKNLFRSLRRSDAEARPSPPAVRTRGGPPPRSTTLQSVDEEGLLEAGSSGALHASPFSTGSPDFSFDEGARSPPSQGGEPSLPGAALLPEGSAAGFSQQEDSYVAAPPPGGCSPGYGSSSSPERGQSPQRLQQEFQQLTDVQCQRALEAEFGQSAEAPPAPPVDAGVQHVLEFDLPCQPADYWCNFLCNSSDFLSKLHTRRGDTNIRISKWQRHYKVGLVRDLQFVSPVKARIGPPQAMCHQTQRVQVFAGHHLLIETSQVMSDIPYADHFSVESRWDVVPAGGGCHVTVHVKVPFTKKTLWRGFIEKGTFDSSLEAAHQFKEMALERLTAAHARGHHRTGTAEAEWGALFGRGVQHGRRHSRAASLSAGVPVGRQLPVLARHRRSPSRLVGVGEGAAHSGGSQSPQRTASLSRLGSQSTCPSPTARQASLHRQHSLQQPPQQQQHPHLQQQSQRPARARSRVLRAAQAVASPPVALLSWLLGLALAAVRAARALSGPAAVCAVGCVILALQAAMLLQQRQQLAHLQARPAAAMQGLVAQEAASLPGLNDSGDSGHAAQHAALMAGLGRDLAALHRAVQQLRDQSDGWRLQLDSLAAAAAGLAARLQQHAAAGAAGS